MNGLLLATKSMRPALYTVPESFHSHPLFAEAVQTDSEGSTFTQPFTFSRKN